MNILHVNCNYIGTTLHQLMIEKLDDLGIENQVFVPTYNKNLAVIEPNTNVCISECFNKWDRLIFDYKQKKIISTLEEIYDIKKFNCIHAYTLFTDGNVARVLSEKYGIPFVVAVRNTDVNDFFAKMVHLRNRGICTMLAAKKIFFLSDVYRKHVFEKYVPNVYYNELYLKTEIVPNGIDDFWLNNEPKETEYKKTFDKNIKLIYVGRIDRNKNIEFTQKAVTELRRRGYNASLTVIGKVIDSKVYEKICKHMYTKVLPAMPKEELISEYRSHDIFVMLSFFESFGLVYAEAISQGVPVIYTRGQGFDGHFKDGEVGHAVEINDVQALIEAIIEIMSNRESYSARCLKRKNKFNWQTIVNYYKDAYNNLC